MELLAEISRSKKIRKTKNITKFQTLESIDNQQFSLKFSEDLRASVADAEDPEIAFNEVLTALKEVQFAKLNDAKLQSAREFMSEF